MDPPLPLNLRNLKQDLKEEFLKEEDYKKCRQEMKGVMQREQELVGDYIDRFYSLWENFPSTCCHKCHQR